MELVAGQRKSSPESAQDSTEHHHRRHHLPAIQPPQLSMAGMIPYDHRVPPAPTGLIFQHGGESSMIGASHVKEEQALPHAPVFSVEHLGWDANELMHSMSPESADLCKNLSSQLEHLRREFGSCYAESSSSSQLVLAADQGGASAVNGEKIVTAASPVTQAGSELVTGAAAGAAAVHPETEMLKAAIVSHPHYPELVAAHMNCHKVGAPPEVATQIDEIIQSFKDFQPAVTTSIGVNPELDQFMVSYFSMLMKYEKEIKKTFKEAVAFCKKLEQQLQGVTNTGLNTVASVESDERNEGYETSDEEDSSAEAEIEVDPMAKDKELKEQLMRKYSGYITSLKHEFLKKKKKGKLPKDSRQQLLNWWSLHYKWPYPSESEKASLAESTGLDQKQINNWFINQRKRHWKPSDDISPLGGQASQSTVGEANSGA